MITLGRLAGTIIVLWSFIYVTSYGVWTWKQKNKFGALMLILLALSALVFPLYYIYIRR